MIINFKLQKGKKSNFNDSELKTIKIIYEILTTTDRGIT